MQLCKAALRCPLMQVEQLTNRQGQPLDGPLLITPKVFGDERGWFFESYQCRFNDAVGKSVVFSQDARQLLRRAQGAALSTAPG